MNRIHKTPLAFAELTPDEFRAFAEKSPYFSFLQTPEIAKLRAQSGWTPHYLGVKEAGKINCACMLVSKPTFLGKSLFLAPGGPLLDLENTKLTNFFLKNLKNYAKNHNGYALRLSPYYELTERDRDGLPVEGGFDHQAAVKNLKNNGFTYQPHSDQPQYLFALDLKNRTPDELLASFKRNTRNHIKKAAKMGVTVRELSRSGLPILKSITSSTSARRGFTDKPLSYYEQMYDLFSPRGEIRYLLAEADAEAKSSASRPSSLAPVVTGLARRTRPVGADGLEAPDFAPTDNSKRTKSDNSSALALTSAIDEATPVTTGGREEARELSDFVPLSVAMFMLTGNEIVYLFSGSDEKYMHDYNAQYAIQWEIIQYAAKNRYKTYNFYGIHSLPGKTHKDGVYEFKKGFGGRVIELIGTYEAPLNAPVCALHHLLSRLKGLRP